MTAKQIISTPATAIITTLISSIMLIYVLASALSQDVKADTKERVSMTITDSIRKVEIATVRESVNNVNKRVDKVEDEQAATNQAILEALQVIKQNQDAEIKVIRQLCKEVNGMSKFIDFLPKESGMMTPVKIDPDYNEKLKNSN
jgi:preprotein translocase subunit SecF